MFFGFIFQAATDSVLPKKDRRPDEDLMRAYKGGDVSGFSELLKRHEAPIFRFCLRALGHRDAATDATQEIFMRVVKNATKWEQKAKFTTWLYTIARNYCIDQKRKGYKRKVYSLNTPLGDAGGTEHQDMVRDETPDADRTIRSHQIREVVDNALQTLPEEQRDVFCLRQYAGLSFKEIAATVDVGENTVKSRMRYALQSVRAALQDAGIKGDLATS